MQIVAKVLLVLLVCQFSIQAQTELFSDLSGRHLLDKVVTEYKPSHVLYYSEAKDLMYSEIYNVDDSVSCVYSGHTLHLPKGIDPSIHLYMDASSDGINAEHTYPRSKGASEDNELGFADLHHLFPTRYAINTSRSNFPFGEIEDEQTTSWFYGNQSQSAMPTSQINKYSERVNGMFEPREDHKGNVARAIFYFYTMYEEFALEADPEFFESQKITLCQWHAQDPVDELEIERTYKIAEHQDDRPNPFVVDCSLAIRTYCEELELPCAYLTTPTTEIELEQLQVYPSPVSDVLYVVADGEYSAKIWDIFGRLLFEKDFVDRTEIEFDAFSAGTYIIQVGDKVTKIIK